MSPHRKGRREAAKRRVQAECLNQAKRQLLADLIKRNYRVRGCDTHRYPNGQEAPVRMYPVGISQTVELNKVRYAMVQSTELRDSIRNGSVGGSHGVIISQSDTNGKQEYKQR